MNGFKWNNDWLSLILVYNKGVAFSMFEFLGPYLKFLQIGLMIAVIGLFYKEKILSNYPILSGMLLGAGISNILDRFTKEGVVDYIYYHGLFNFAVFNFADIIIDISIAMLLWYNFNKKDLT